MADENIDLVLMVTSALHMRRSEAAFRAVGLEPIPVADRFLKLADPPTDVCAAGYHSGRRNWQGAPRAVHEYVGY